MLTFLFLKGIQCQADGGDDYGGWAEGYYVIDPYSLGNTWKHYYSVGGNNLQLAIKNAQKLLLSIIMELLNVKLF